MQTIRNLTIPVVAVWLLALVPSIGAEDFDQRNPTPTPEGDFGQENTSPGYESKDGELQADDGTYEFSVGTCVETNQAVVCYFPERNEFMVRDADKDGYSAVGRWYLDADEDGTTTSDADDRQGWCRNPHGYDTWAVCRMDFESDGVPLSFAAQAVDLDNSHGGADGPRSAWEQSET